MNLQQILTNVALYNSTSFKYKASILGKAYDADVNDRSLKKMPLINCKIHLELNWNNDCVMYGADTYAGGDNVNNREATFQITSTVCSSCYFCFSCYFIN